MSFSFWIKMQKEYMYIKHLLDCFYNVEFDFCVTPVFDKANYFP